MFPDKVLADFKAFCANENGRLEAFWNSCVGKMTPRQAEDDDDDYDDDKEPDEADSAPSFIAV